MNDQNARPTTLHGIVPGEKTLAFEIAMIVGHLLGLDRSVRRNRSRHHSSQHGESTQHFPIPFRWGNLRDVNGECCSILTQKDSHAIEHLIVLAASVPMPEFGFRTESRTVLEIAASLPSR